MQLRLHLLSDVSYRTSNLQIVMRYQKAAHSECILSIVGGLSML